MEVHRTILVRPDSSMARVLGAFLPSKNRSIGEAPFTIATVFVTGKTRKIFSKRAGTSCVTGTTVSFTVSFSYWIRRVYGCNDHRYPWKETLAISLDEVRCGGRRWRR